MRRKVSCSIKLEVCAGKTVKRARAVIWDCWNQNWDLSDPCSTCSIYSFSFFLFHRTILRRELSRITVFSMRTSCWKKSIWIQAFSDPSEFQEFNQSAKSSFYRFSVFFFNFSSLRRSWYFKRLSCDLEMLGAASDLSSSLETRLWYITCRRCCGIILPDKWECSTRSRRRLFFAILFLEAHVDHPLRNFWTKGGFPGWRWCKFGVTLLILEGFLYQL